MLDAAHGKGPRAFVGVQREDERGPEVERRRTAIASFARGGRPKPATGTHIAQGSRIVAVARSRRKERSLE